MDNLIYSLCISLFDVTDIIQKIKETVHLVFYLFLFLFLSCSATNTGRRGLRTGLQGPTAC
jgi:hypothetical protein